MTADIREITVDQVGISEIGTKRRRQNRVDIEGKLWSEPSGTGTQRKAAAPTEEVHYLKLCLHCSFRCLIVCVNTLLDQFFPFVDGYN